MRRIFSAVVLLMLVNATAFSQASKSPLTAQGIGEFNDLSLIHNDGMGGVGISTPSLWYMNSMNPALLPFNTLTVFGAGFATERRTIESEDASSINSGGNISYLGSALPIINGRWTTAIGLAPYSSVAYEHTTIEPVPGTGGEIGIREKGTGGFNQFYWSNGVRLGNSFYLGARASYLFSSIVQESESYPSDTTFSTNFIIALYDRVSVSDIMLSTGAAFVKDSLFNKNIRMSVGVTYDFNSEINAEGFRSIERRSVQNIALDADTILNEEGSITLPSRYGFGVTFSKGFNWSASFELQMQGWSDYKNFFGSNNNFSDGMRAVIGGEITPDYASVDNYLKRISYRAGVSYSLLPYTINTNQVKEVGINFGLSLPVSRFSSIDLSLGYKNRGNIEQTTLKENVLRFGLGITFNDQWFIRRKYD